MATVKANADSVAVPPAKKFKQATLSFKPMEVKKTPTVNQTTPNSKKRKLSNDGAVVPPIKKTPRRSEEFVSRKSYSEDKENEVSSSSEADALTVIGETKNCARKVGLLDKFVRTTQQQEISTSSSEEVIMVDDESNQEPVSTSLVNSDEDAKCASSKSNARENVCKEGHNTDLATLPSCVMENSDSVDSETGKKRLAISLCNTPTKQCVSFTENNNITHRNEPDKDKMKHDATVQQDENKAQDIGLNSSLESNTSLVSDSNTSTCEATPAKGLSPSNTGQKTAKKTPMSKKQQEKELERQKRKEEREKERLEKQKQREEAKAEKERQKREEKEKKEQEKQKKEQERKEKQEQKEKERLEKLKIKEDEKKKKQEEIDAKNEEKKKNDEEKRKLEETKRLIEEEKQRKKNKEKAVFTGFFKKQSQIPKETVKPDTTTGNFMPFHLKANMKMAPVSRVDSTELVTRLPVFDINFKNQETSQDLYLMELNSGKYQPSKSEKTWKYEETSQNEVEIVDADNDKDKTDVAPKKTGKMMKAKFLKFHENYRPAYYGTWRKKSKHITARKPLGKDGVLLDYSVDSDDDWEEEEPGESLSNSEGEDEGDDAGNKEDDDDGFFVPHGYLSDDEGAGNSDDEVQTPDRMKAKQIAKAKAWEMELQKKVNQLKAMIIGCIWFDKDVPSSPEADELQKYKMTPLIEFTESIPVSGQCKTTPNISEGKNRNSSGNSQRRPVPEEAMEDLVKLVHGNTSGIQKLMREFRAFWRQKQNGTKDSQDHMDNDADGEEKAKSTENLDSNIEMISKRQLEIKIKSIATYEKRDPYRKVCWYVNSEQLEKYKLNDLPVPTQWKYVTKTGKPAMEKTPTTPKTPVIKATNVISKSSPSIAQFAVPQSPDSIISQASQAVAAAKTTCAVNMETDQNQEVVMPSTPNSEQLASPLPVTPTSEKKRTVSSTEEAMDMSPSPQAHDLKQPVSASPKPFGNPALMAKWLSSKPSSAKKQKPNPADEEKATNTEITTTGNEPKAESKQEAKVNNSLLKAFLKEKPVNINNIKNKMTVTDFGKRPSSPSLPKDAVVADLSNVETAKGDPEVTQNTPVNVVVNSQYNEIIILDD